MGSPTAALAEAAGSGSRYDGVCQCSQANRSVDVGIEVRNPVETMPLLYVPTIYVLMLAVMVLLGALTFFAWLQNRAVRALAWWSG